MGDLSKNFDKVEFECKCGCGFADVDTQLVSMLQAMRDLVGPIFITSGCRCPEHNKNEGGKANSAHLTGKAVDIVCVDSYQRFMYLVAALQVGFERIGIHKTFMHLDVDDTKPQLRCWPY